MKKWFNSYCFIHKFDETMPNYKFKAAALNKEDTFVKKSRFFQDFELRCEANLMFISKCRFLFSDLPPKMLSNVFFDIIKSKFYKVCESCNWGYRKF